MGSSGLDGFCFIYQGHPFFQKATYGDVTSEIVVLGVLHQVGVAPRCSWACRFLPVSMTLRWVHDPLIVGNDVICFIGHADPR